MQLINHYRENYVQNSHNPICNYGLVMELGDRSLSEVLPDHEYPFALGDVKHFLANLIAVGAYL